PGAFVLVDSHADRGWPGRRPSGVQAHGRGRWAHTLAWARVMGRRRRIGAGCWRRLVFAQTSAICPFRRVRRTAGRLAEDGRVPRPRVKRLNEQSESKGDFKCLTRKRLVVTIRRF